MKKSKLVFYFSIFLALLIFPANTFPFNNPGYAASNANLFVSAENSQWNNYFAGPQVIEVIVIDSDISQLDQAYGEPVVTVNGKRLRMAQAMDGNWYAYFADRNQAIAAANTALIPGKGLNFGGFCGPNSAQPKAGVDYSDTKGFTIARGGFGSIVHNATFVLTSSAVQNAHCTTGVPATIMSMEHVVRENKTLNQNPLGFAAGSTYGQIWPVIQLYDFSIPSAVTIDYQRHGGDQIVNLTFDRIPQNLISINVVGPTDTQNSPVLATLNDPQLNIDPTDEDSWSWGSDSAKKALYYQAFDRNGKPDAITISGAMQNLVGNLTTLMFNHNGKLIIDPKASGERIMDFQSNGMQTIFPSRGDPATVSLSPLVSVSQPITFVEKSGVNTGVFGNWDDKNMSNMVIIDSPIIQGKVTNFTYNDVTVTKTWTYVPNTSEQYRILLKSGSFLPQPGINVASIKNNHQPDDLIHFLVQFPQLPSYNDRSMLSTNHIKLDDYITGNTYVASAKFSDVDNLNNLSKLRWADKFDPEKKLSPTLRLINLDKTPEWAKSNGMITLTIILNEDGNIQEVADNVTNLLNGTLEAVVPLAPSVTVSFDQNNIGMILNKIAGDDNVQWIDFVDPPLYPANDQARTSSGVDAISNITPPLGLDGNGVKVFIYDASFIADHPAFGTRLTRDTTIINPRMDTHATHVAGTLGGDGSLSPSPKNLKGMAPGITILSGAFLKSDGLNPTNDNGDEIQNNFTSAINSHGVNLASMSLSSNLNSGQIQWLGNYSHTSLLIDKIVSGKLFKPLIFFEAVGNVREWSNPLCSCTATPFEFNSTEPPATAKNSIAVGAINSDDYSTTSYTSFGPTSDGRIKPDIMAAGSHSEDVTNWTVDGLISTWFTTDAAGNRIWSYHYDHGTSMATPVAAGVGALLIQEWKNTDHGDLFQRLQSNIPPPHTVKALLIHSATDLESPGPDYKTGWGAINATSAIMLVMKNGSNIMNHEVVIHEDIIRENHENKTYSFIPTNSTNCVKATLVWDDANSTVIASKQLVNNLDLRLEDSSKNIFQPFVLLPNDPTASAKPGNDDVNNVEMVVGGPNVGKWTAMVNGTGIAIPPQNYTLIISEIPNPTRGVCPAQGVIPPTPDFSISTPVDMINVQAGNSMSVMVNLSPIGGFSGPVSFSTPSLPSGISTTFSPNTLNLGSSPMSSTLTFSTSSGTTPGPYAITILSTSGTITNSAIIHVVVTPPITPNHVLTIHESVNKGMFGEDLPISAFPVTIEDSPGGPVNLTNGNSKILPAGVYHLSVPSPGGFNGRFNSSCSGGVVTLDHDVTCDVENNHCLIATAAFGSELAPEVQFLRDFRDAHLQKTSVGSDFMNVFNQWYYSFSPYVANYENQNPALREIIKDSLYPLLSILVVSEKAFFLIGGNYGTMVAGLIAISMIGAVYVSPMTLSIKGIRTGNLRLKSIFITVSSLLGITIVAILSGNQTVIMISCLLFLLSLMCITALLTAKMYVRIAKGIDKKLKNMRK